MSEDSALNPRNITPQQLGEWCRPGVQARLALGLEAEDVTTAEMLNLAAGMIAAAFREMSAAQKMDFADVLDLIERSARWQVAFQQMVGLSMTQDEMEALLLTTAATPRQPPEAPAA